MWGQNHAAAFWRKQWHIETLQCSKQSSKHQGPTCAQLNTFQNQFCRYSLSEEDSNTWSYTVTTKVLQQGLQYTAVFIIIEIKLVYT